MAVAKVMPATPSAAQLEEERFFTALLANEDVEVMSLDACTAASLGHIEQLTRFAAGDLDSANRSGWTPLMYAACLGHTETVKYLGRRRVSCSFFAGKCDNNEGRQQTALMLAAANGHDESVSALLALPDCRANATDTRGWTALFYAIAYGHPSTAELLLKNGADPNVPERQRQASALVIAAEAGHDDIVRILLRHGADANQKTRDGCLPIDVASYRGHLQVVNLLHKAQSKQGRPPAASSSSNESPVTTSTPSKNVQSPRPDVGKLAPSKPAVMGMATIVDSELAKMLAKLGLEHYAKDFAAGAITYDSLMRLSEEDLRQLPFLTVGARKQLMIEISSKQRANDGKAPSSDTTNEAKDLSKDFAKIFIPTARIRNPKSTFAHFLGHVSVLVSNCSLLDDNQRHQLSDAVGTALKNIQASNADTTPTSEKKLADSDVAFEEIVSKMESINSYFDAFLAQS